MSFLNKSVLQKKAEEAAAEPHPLLNECDVPLNVKQAYLQGCVLAVLERDDGKVTDAARQEIARLGLSLEMSRGDIGECISVASGLSTPDAQDDFLGELFSTLAGDVYSRYFMKDFESLIANGGAPSEGVKETVECFGRSLIGKVDWRQTAVKYKIDADKCKGCTMCARECPTGAISGVVKRPHVIDQAKCNGCGACETKCLFKAVGHG